MIIDHLTSDLKTSKGLHIIYSIQDEIAKIVIIHICC